MASEIKKFYRSRKDRVLFGVAGGLGEYFKIDPVLFRLLFVLLFFINGAGLLLYVIMVLVTQSEPAKNNKGGEDNLEGEFNELAGRVEKKVKELSLEAEGDDKKTAGSRSLLGGIIIALGLFLLLRQFFPAIWIDMNAIWALLIIGIGFYIIFKNKQ